jgi:MFS family permease
MASVAAGTTGYIAAFTAAALAAQDITGSQALSGIPNATGVAGMALGAGLLSAVMSRRDRRTGLVVGNITALLGAALAILSLEINSFALLIIASLLFGIGNAGLQLTRYAASDQVAPEHRAGAVGLVVWGATVGAVLGPNLLQPAAGLVQAIGRPPLEGGFDVLVVGFLLALAIAMFGIPGHRAVQADDAPPLSRRELLAHVPVRIAILGLVGVQVVMVLIMTMTPLHVRETGHDLATVGFVISAHTFGMFALSPLSGRLVERVGAVPVLFGGFGALLLAALLGAIAPPDGVPLLTLALFLLGFGWNLGFVSGSSLLTTGASLAERIRLQGLTDAVVWTSAAVASVVSGPLLALSGFSVLALVGGALLALPVAGIALLRRGVVAEPA